MEVYCSEFISNVSRNLKRMMSTSDVNVSSVERVDRMINGFAIPIVGSFGVIGNLLNLVVLTRKSLHRSMKRFEMSAHVGLVALSLSDLMVCVVYLVGALFEERVVYSTIDFSIFILYFYTYKEPIFNIFLLTSTWVTVVMAISRYLVVCRPLHARGIISIGATRLVLAAVYICSLLLNLPRFWHYTVSHYPCHPSLLYESHSDDQSNSELVFNCTYLQRSIGGFYPRNKVALLVYNVTYAILGIFIPLAVLSVCNICLVRALRRSQQLQKSCVVSSSTIQSQTDTRHRITPTLVGLIIIFVAFVGPSEVLAFFKQHVVQAKFQLFKLAIIVTNFLQLVNFAVNFVLYCILNVEFRKTLANLLMCRREQIESPAPRSGGKTKESAMI